MEGFSSIERVVGDVPEEVKQNMLEISDEKFSHNENNEFFEGKEKEKSLEELQMIEMAADSLDQLRFKYGLDPIEVPPENIHVVFENSFKEKMKEIDGIFNAKEQGMIVEEKSTRVEFMALVTHEMTHFKSYAALQVPQNSTNVENYRLGLRVVDRNNKNKYFRALNEGITEEITKRICFEKFLTNSLFAEEISLTKENTKRGRKLVNTRTKKSLVNNDLFYLDLKKEKDNFIVNHRAEFTRPNERKALNLVIDALFVENQDKYENRTQIYEEFEKAMFSGNILTIGKLVDRTFGEGSFRKIGEATSENIVEIVEGLITA